MNRDVELLPDEFFVRAMYKKRAVMWVLVSIALVGAVCLVAYLQAGMVTRLERENAPLRQSVDSLKGMGDQVASLAKGLEVTAGRQRALEDILKKPEWSALIREVAQATDGELWLTELTIIELSSDESRGGAITSSIVMRGVAPSNLEVSRFMRRLSASGHLEELQLDSSHRPRSQDGSSKVEFGISGTAL